MDRSQLAMLSRKFIREAEEFIEANLQSDEGEASGSMVSRRPLAVDEVVEELPFDCAQSIG